jgi:hypothetical protein
MATNEYDAIVVGGSVRGLTNGNAAGAQRP